MGVLAFGLGIAGDTTVIQMTVPISAQLVATTTDVTASITTTADLSAVLDSTTTSIVCEVQEA